MTIKSHIHKIAKIAIEVSKRGTCDRLQVGAVWFENPLQIILGTGFNHRPYGKSCKYNGHVFNEKGGCIGTIHAEMDAMVDAIHNRYDIYSQCLFITHMPCYYCSKVLVELKVQQLWYIHDYESKGSYGSGKKLLEESGVRVLKYEQKL